MIWPLLHCRIEDLQPVISNVNVHMQSNVSAISLKGGKGRLKMRQRSCWRWLWLDVLWRLPLENMSRVPFRGNPVCVYALNCRFIPIWHILTLQISLATELVGSAITIALSSVTGLK